MEDAKERLCEAFTAAHWEQLQGQQAEHSGESITETNGSQGKNVTQSIIRTRRTADPREVKEATRAWGSSDNGTRGKGSVGSKKEADRNLASVLNDTLPDDEVRADFVSIVRDMEKRAETFTEKYKNVRFIFVGLYKYCAYYMFCLTLEVGIRG